MVLPPLFLSTGTVPEVPEVSIIVYRQAEVETSAGKLLVKAVHSAELRVGTKIARALPLLTLRQTPKALTTWEVPALMRIAWALGIPIKLNTVISEAIFKYRALYQRRALSSRPPRARHHPR